MQNGKYLLTITTHKMKLQTAGSNRYNFNSHSLEIW